MNKRLERLEKMREEKLKILFDSFVSVFWGGSDLDIEINGDSVDDVNDDSVVKEYYFQQENMECIHYSQHYFYLEYKNGDDVSLRDFSFEDDDYDYEVSYYIDFLDDEIRWEKKNME